MTDVNVKADKKTAIGVIQILIGSILFFIFLIIALLNRVWASITGDTISTSAAIIFICIIISGFIIWKGFRNYKLASRYRRIFKAIGNDTSIKLSALEQKLGWDKNKIKKAIKQQISLGYWVNPYIDDVNEIFILRYNPVQLKTDSENKAINDILNKANNYIYDMSSRSRAITDEDLCNQVNILIDIANQVYDFVEKEHEKARLVRQFTNYFLPTTVELLTSYLEIQNQTVKTDSMIESMEKIKDMMKIIETAFKKQLDTVYSDKALDVSIEIDVMKGIIDNTV